MSTSPEQQIAHTNPSESFRPGNVIHLNTERDLRDFEDKLGSIMKPTMTEEQKYDWAYRRPVDELIRPAGFNGNIKNIQLAPMKDAFDWLVDANPCGDKFIQSFAPHHKTFDRDFAPEEKRAYLGFHLMAYAVSQSAKHGMQRIDASIWYVPQSKNYSHAANVNGGIRRYISRPENLQSKFDEARRRSIRAVGAAGITQGRAVS